MVAHSARLRDVWGLQCLQWQSHSTAGMLPFCLLLHPHPAPDHQPHVPGLNEVFATRMACFVTALIRMML